MPLYSVGYAQLCPADLAGLASALRATVIDVRSCAWGRVKRGFSRADLTALLPGAYEWRGDALGGRRAGPTLAGIDRLQADHAAGRSLLLLCAEEAPADCHRHHAIAMPLHARGVEVTHVYRQEAFAAASLQAALDEDALTGTDTAEYQAEALADLIASLSSASAPL